MKQKSVIGNEILILGAGPTATRCGNRAFFFCRKALRGGGLALFFLILFSSLSYAEEGIASWYSVESCRREGTSGIMANGEVFNDENFTCASWDYPFGTVLLVINTSTNNTVRVCVTDRGPNRRLYKKGRKIDLSKRAFSEIADLKQGVILVKIEEARK